MVGNVKVKCAEQKEQVANSRVKDTLPGEGRWNTQKILLKGLREERL
jgi:hypothetical protein